jgi:hypothetical protein
MSEFQIGSFGGAPNPPQGINPDTFAQQYATEKGISLEEAKQQLKAKFGDPQKPNSTFVPNGSGVTFAQANTAWFNNFNVQNNQSFAYTRNKDDDAKLEMLLQYGIPADVIIQGDDAIRKYAQDHNIDLPAKERN